MADTLDVHIVVRDCSTPSAAPHVSSLNRGTHSTHMHSAQLAENYEFLVSDSQWEMPLAVSQSGVCSRHTTLVPPMTSGCPFSGEWSNQMPRHRNKSYFLDP